MGEARRNWEKNLIATAALMGAEFTHHYHSQGEKSNWQVNIPVNPTATQIAQANRMGGMVRLHRTPYQSQWQAAYWYLVNVHRLSFQNNGNLEPCGPLAKGYEHSEASVRRHQGKVRERIRRSMHEKDRKWRRDRKNLLK